MGLMNILKGRSTSETYPEYKFTWINRLFQALPGRYPEKPQRSQFVAEVGSRSSAGWMSCRDDVKPGGSSSSDKCLRQNLLRDHLGLDVKVAWLLDTFGHHAQMRNFSGRPGFIHSGFAAVCQTTACPPNSRWRGIDGTESLLLVAGFLRSVLMVRHGNSLTSRNFLKPDFTRSISMLPGRTVGLAGVDVCVPEDYVPPLTRNLNRQPGAAFQIRYSIRANLPTWLLAEGSCRGSPMT